MQVDCLGTFVCDDHAILPTYPPATQAQSPITCPGLSTGSTLPLTDNGPIYASESDP